jgi:predicted ATP-binding protein involved in virulence
MRLLRVQVPEFRALKDVDITFEKDFTPAVFPIGSQNGGGKSTLLQLIFTLLHCPFNKDREHFLRNILNQSKTEFKPKLLARFNMIDIEDDFILEFFTIKNKIELNLGDDQKPVNIIFSSIKEAEKLNSEISRIANQKKDTEYLLAKSKHKVFDENDVEEFKKCFIETIIRQGLPVSSEETSLLNSLSSKNLEFVFSKLVKVAQEYDEKISELIGNSSAISETTTATKNYLLEGNFNFICTYESGEDQLGALLCRCLKKDVDIEALLCKISKKIFLAAPSTQVFIFTDKNSQKLLFKSDSQAKAYHSLVKNLEGELPGIFTYDFLSVDLLTNAFKNARDKDFEVAVTSGEYGNNYKSLISDLNLMLSNKKINVSPDLSEIIFKLSSGSGDELDLYPEDLSHGELKRLSLYMWLRSKLIEDSIVLMDEVEIAFHPDWQYQIVSDLAHWAPSNQYILATHSYELCQAVTPAHVKELEPKLLKSEN